MSGSAGDGPAPAAARGGLGTASLLLGIVAAAGSVLFALVAHGMRKESAGRSIEGADDGSSEVLGAVACVGSMFAAVAVAGLALGFVALGRNGAARGRAAVGVALCAAWIVVAAFVVLDLT